MSFEHITIDPNQVEHHKLARAAGRFAEGSLAVLPTDTNYVLACRLGDKAAIGRLRLARSLKTSHLLTLVLADFSSLGKYAVVDNIHFRLLRELVPGPYTFILPATKEVPRAFAHRKRKSIGVRLPDAETLNSFQRALAEPLISATLKPPNNDKPIVALDSHISWLGKVVDLIVDSGPLSGGVTTILDLLVSPEISVARQGNGATNFLED